MRPTSPSTAAMDSPTAPAFSHTQGMPDAHHPVRRGRALEACSLWRIYR